MTRSPSGDDEATPLFDLPLHAPPPGAGEDELRRRTPARDEEAPTREAGPGDEEESPRDREEPPRRSRRRGRRASNLPLFEDGSPLEGQTPPEDRPHFEEGLQFEDEALNEGREEPLLGPPPAEPSPPSLGDRLLAGLADVAILAGVGLTLVGGAWILGVPPAAGHLPPLALALLTFSLLFSVVPLAFWGRTPGMAWRGITARGPGLGPLTFGQSGRRWLGGLLTCLLLGLPLLLAALAGGSLADRMSGSRSYRTDTLPGPPDQPDR